MRRRVEASSSSIASLAAAAVWTVADSSAQDAPRPAPAPRRARQEPLVLVLEGSSRAKPPR